MEAGGRGLWLAMLIMIMVIGEGEAQLVGGFYNSSCPNLESIVRQAVAKKANQSFITIPGTLRLFFHDCFCSGCEASIMISSPNGDAEKDAPDNLTLEGDGFDTVVKSKAAVEAVCPGVVSCADIMAIAARDVVVLAGGPSWEVEMGRRDGLVSKASLVAGKLPGPNFNLTQLNTLFAKNNLTQLDMIALSGAHTLGSSHCNNFANRLYNFSNSNQTDPSLNQTYAKQLMGDCPKNGDPQVVIGLDSQTPQAFDNAYYQDLVGGRGLLSSDEVLYTDLASQFTVKEFAGNSGVFNQAFAAAMIKLGRVGVLTGSQGQIRKDCTAFNS